MHPHVKRRYGDIIRSTGIRPERALEVGGLVGPKSLMRFPEPADAERYCLNLTQQPADGEITAIQANANDMRGVFRSDWFDPIVCNATLEHDKRFWLSVAEMRRVLKPGGLMVISVPGYVRGPERETGRSTLTYRVHYKVDYYRFSKRTVRDVFFAGMERVRVEHAMTPPRIFGYGYKPQPASRADRAISHARRVAGRTRGFVRRRRTRL